MSLLARIWSAGLLGRVRWLFLACTVVAYTSVLVHALSTGLSPAWRAAALGALALPATAMAALASAVRRHQRTADRERILTDVTSELLSARDVQDVAAAAIHGFRRLTGQEDTGASLWLADGTDLVLVAEEGVTSATTPRFSLHHVPEATRSDYLAGLPFRTDAAMTRQLEQQFGVEAEHLCFVALPLGRPDDLPRGAVVGGVYRPLDAEVDDLLARFANEVSLALERAELLEELNRSNHDLRAADETKNRFVSTVSHELRTPLTAICGFSEILASRWEHLGDAARLDLLARIRRQAARQRRLVDDLLIMSRIATGQLRPVPVTVDVAVAVQEAVTNLQLGARLRLRIPLGAEVVADPDHLQQILDNLLTNAVKYGAPPFELDVEPTTDRLAITVRDAGPGVPSDFVPFMFDRFQQADGSDRRSGQGIGLGLAIVKELVDHNGGSLAYAPAAHDGTGAAFTVALPSPMTRGPQPAGRVPTANRPAAERATGVSLSSPVRPTVEPPAGEVTWDPVASAERSTTSAAS